MVEFKLGDKVRSKMDHNLVGTISEIRYEYWYDQIDKVVTVIVMSEEGYMKYETFNAVDIEKIDEEKENKEMTSYKVGDIVDHPLYNESIIIDISEFETGYISILPLTGYRRRQTILVSIDNVKLSDNKFRLISTDNYNEMANTIENLKEKNNCLKDEITTFKLREAINANSLLYHFCCKIPEVKEVLYHKPATIIFWKDGTNTVVKAQNKEKYDKEKGFVMAYIKKILGNKGNYYDEIKRWTK